LLHGIFTPAITIFDRNGRLDYQGNEIVINRLVEQGVDGILVLGSIGEFFTMTAAEKRDLIGLAVRTVARRVPVLIGTGGTVVAEVIELTQYAQKAGADYAVVISPYYFRLDEESLYRYYAAVAQAVDLPVLLYNFPDRTAVDLSPQLVLRLARDFANIAGIKDTVDNISHTRKLIQTVKRVLPDFAVFSGFDEYLTLNLSAGGNGVIGGLSNLAPQLFVRLYRAYLEKDLSSVVVLQRRINALMTIYDVSQPFVAAIKAATALLVPGVSPISRPPAAVLTDESVSRIQDILETAQVAGKTR
jgi:4-hydroxy-tetrahydrodipicolinate synthase